MLIKFLGTGTSTGVPEIGCNCKVCQSNNPKDTRLRSSVLLNMDNGKNILIDCGPDFREQMLNLPFKPIDALLITHEHYDHVGGIDDLRPFCKFGDIQIYVEQYVGEALRNRIPYCFVENKYPGVPQLNLNYIENAPFQIGENIEIIPIRVMHGKLPIFGYRIKDLVYITDVKTIPEEELDKLQNVEVLVMNALRIKDHPSHQNLEQAIKQAKRIGAKKTFFIHMSHDIGLHDEIEQQLPSNMFFAYDGLNIKI